MKKILSVLSGRLMSVFFPIALIVSFLVPANVSARLEDLQIGIGDPWVIGVVEGDPLDTNDYGSSRGGGGTSISDKSSTGSVPRPFGFEFDRIQILLIPEFVGGTLIFKIMVVDKTALGMRDLSPEGTHAP